MKWNNFLKSFINSIAQWVCAWRRSYFYTVYDTLEKTKKSHFEAHKSILWEEENARMGKKKKNQQMIHS